jgi:hypothetical protein
MRVGLLGLCALLLVAGSCWDEEKPCKSSADCATGEVCAGSATSRYYYCMKDCTQTGECPMGGECESVVNADCPECRVVTKACHVNRPL